MQFNDSDSGMTLSAIINPHYLFWLLKVPTKQRWKSSSAPTDLIYELFLWISTVFKTHICCIFKSVHMRKNGTVRRIFYKDHRHFIGSMDIMHFCSIFLHIHIQHGCAAHSCNWHWHQIDHTEKISKYEWELNQKKAYNTMRKHKKRRLKWQTAEVCADCT